MCGRCRCPTASAGSPGCSCGTNCGGRARSRTHPPCISLPLLASMRTASGPSHRVWSRLLPPRCTTHVVCACSTRRLCCFAKARALACCMQPCPVRLPPRDAFNIDQPRRDASRDGQHLYPMSTSSAYESPITMASTTGLWLDPCGLGRKCVRLRRLPKKRSDVHSARESLSNGGGGDEVGVR